MVVKTRVTGRGAWRGGLSLLIVLGMTCAFAGEVQAAGSTQLQVFDPFAMKLSAVSNSVAMNQIVRIRAEIRNVSVGRSIPAAATVVAAETDPGADLRRPAIRVPFKPPVRSPFTPPGF
jgi:hypothetical protein